MNRPILKVASNEKDKGMTDKLHHLMASYLSKEVSEIQKSYLIFYFQHRQPRRVHSRQDQIWFQINTLLPSCGSLGPRQTHWKFQRYPSSFQPRQLQKSLLPFSLIFNWKMPPKRSQ